MSDGNWLREAKIHMGMKWFLVNEEYQRLICTRKRCGVGLELCGVEKHMIKRHEVEKTLARGVQMGIRAAQEGKGWDECSKKRPRNGLMPQKGLAVFDGFQYRFCEESPARRVEDVEHHLYEMHRETEGHIWDEVRMQSWGGKGRVGDEFWIVDESKQSEEKKAEDESLEDFVDELDEFDDEGWSEGRSQGVGGDSGDWDDEDLSTWGLSGGDEVGEETEEEWIFTK
ncbi:hypothetical protein VE00_10013 [Pseudogymnoascus sp. WSF 3629]|nr:hypothetical protein VE00_10013 [Pseudogymnoascus sp. WSF 3629]